MLIVVTGGLVRLTGSGLGCPTWPKCTEESLVTVPEQGIHGVIEFANRTLTGVLALIALATFVTVMRLAKSERKGLVWPSLWLGFGVIFQAILGGITVLTKLTWWIVGAHFLVSALMIVIAAILVWNFYRPETVQTPNLVRNLANPVSLLGAVAVCIGVVVSGAGPHAGDLHTPRSGLDIEIWEHYHSYPAYLLLVLVMIQLARLLPGDRQKAFREWRVPTRVTALLLVNLVLQAAVGVAQARLGVPAGLVIIHMALATTAVALLTWQSLSLRRK